MSEQRVHDLLGRLYGLEGAAWSEASATLARPKKHLACCVFHGFVDFGEIDEAPASEECTCELDESSLGSREPDEDPDDLVEVIPGAMMRPAIYGVSMSAQEWRERVLAAAEMEAAALEAADAD